MKHNKLKNAWKITGAFYVLLAILFSILVLCDWPIPKLEELGTPFTILGLGLNMFFWGAMFDYID